MFTASDVSVVIPSYNSRSSIGKCLDALKAQEAQPLEIIVADSGKDGVIEYIKEKYPEVRTYQFKNRTFPGPARNIGVEMAHGQIVAFIDSDCIAAPDWVSRIAHGHSLGYLIVGGAVEVGNPLSTVAWAGHLAEFRDFLPVGEPRLMVHVPTCNISYRRMLFDRYGGFPNAYYPQEDLLFNYLLHQRGFWVWFNPSIRIAHFCREGVNSYLSHQHRLGRVTRVTLTRIDMEGELFARQPWLAILFSPFLGMLKAIRNSSIMLRKFPRVVLRHPGLLPLITLGAAWWSRGFAEGARTGLSGIRGWLEPDEPIFAQLELARQTETHDPDATRPVDH